MLVVARLKPITGRPARHRPWGDQQNLRPDLGCRNLSCCCFCNDHEGRHRIGWVLVELLSKLSMEVLKSWQLYLSECDPNKGTVTHYNVRNNMHEIAVSRPLMNIQNTIMSVALVPFPFRLSLLCAPWWLFHIYFLTSTTKLCKTSLHRHSLVALQQESSATVHLNWTQTRCSSSWSWRTIGFCSRIAVLWQNMLHYEVSRQSYVGIVCFCDIMSVFTKANYGRSLYLSLCNFG